MCGMKKTSRSSERVAVPDPKQVRQQQQLAVAIAYEHDSERRSVAADLQRASLRKTTS